jgi:hypothetical protein
MPWALLCDQSLHAERRLPARSVQPPMKMSYKELDSRALKQAVSRGEEIEIKIPSQHAKALDSLIEIVNDIRSWSRNEVSVLKKWITLQKAFFLAIRALFSHAQLAELLPLLVFSRLSVQLSHGEDGSRILLIDPN